MDGEVLADRFSRGMGSAARVFGVAYDVYRPKGCEKPLRSEHRFLRMCAAFDGGYPGYRRPRGYERALRGTFDAVCTMVGDYLVGPRGVLFVAARPPMLRPLCVLTTATVDVLRPVGAESIGLNGYGGVQEPRLRHVLTGWPAELLGGSDGGGGQLPIDGGLPRWSVLLPPTSATILGSDLVQDETGRRFVVRTAERSEFGWRLSVRQAGV